MLWLTHARLVYSLLLGTPRKSFSRSNSIMSSETYPLHQSTSTMPVPASRRVQREPDVNRNYNTLGVGTHFSLVTN